MPLFQSQTSWLQKDADGNRIRSNQNEESPSFISSLINKVMNNKVYYTYYTIFVLLFILSFVDLIMTFNNSNKSKAWEYVIGLLGLISPVILFGVKAMHKEQKIAVM